jgi:protein SCO1/2
MPMDRRLIATLSLAALVALGAMIFAIVGINNQSNTGTAETAPIVSQSPSSQFEGALLPPGVRAPNFSLRDENGKRVTMKEYRGKVVVVTFLYSHCKTECPVQAQQIKGALDDIGKPVPVLSVSVDPPGDTPKSVKHFNAKMGVSGRLRWVLGSEGQLSRLWKGFAIVPQTPQQEHMARIVLIDQKGMQRIGFPASQTTPERLAHDIKALQAD